jgi:peptidoglycan LD-endopeptidase CwlK
MIDSRDINELDPVVKAACERHVAACAAEGVTLLITSTYRDYERQNAIYAQGRTTPGKIVTHAQAGQSFHNFRAAYDAVPLIDGKADWDVSSPQFQRMVELARGSGLECGFDWPGGLKDSDHFEVKPLAQWSMAESKQIFDEHGTLFIA